MDTAPAESSTEQERAAARREIRLAAFAVLGIVVAGLAAIPIASRPEYTIYSLFYEQYVRIEPASLVLLGLFIVALLVGLRSREDDGWLWRPGSKRWPVAVASVAVVLIVSLGTVFVLRNYLFADDEYAAWFQAQVYARGRTFAAAPPQWCPWIAALTPSIVIPAGCEWRLGFLPIHSLLTSGFIAVGIGRLSGAFVAGISILLTASIARKLWPESPGRAYVAAALLASSTQLLFMSMTMFSMSTHLLLALLWLRLYVDDRWWALVLLPWVGVVALGVHSPFPHIWLIPPFMLRYLRDRRYLAFGYVAAVYAVGLSFWYAFHNALARGGTAALEPVSSTLSVVARTVHLPTSVAGITTAMHVALAATWNSPILFLLVIAAILSWKQLDAFSRDAALSLLCMVGARVFTSGPQGIGWGYRYVYAGLGLLALLGAVGADRLAAAIGSRKAIRLIAASVAVSLLVQLPLRARNVTEIISPYRRGSEWLSRLPYDAVVFPADMVRWGRQLVRNDPFLTNTPKILSRRDLTPAQLDALRRSAGLRTVVLTRDDLKAHGLPLAVFSFGGFVIEE